MTTVTRPEQGRYRMTINMFINNLTNRTNFMNYSGVRTSPFFLQPTTSQMGRRIHVGTNLKF